MLFDKDNLRKSAEIGKNSPLRNLAPSGAFADRPNFHPKTAENKDNALISRAVFDKKSRRDKNINSVDIQNPQILAFLKKECAEKMGTFDENIGFHGKTRGRCNCRREWWLEEEPVMGSQPKGVSRTIFHLFTKLILIFL